MKKNIKNILLPYFPDSPWLKKQWWHRLILIIATILTLSSYAAICIILLTNLKIFSNMLPLIIPLWLLSTVSFGILQFFLPGTSMGSFEESVFIILGLLAIAFIPNFIYRIILYVATNNKWNNSLR